MTNEVVLWMGVPALPAAVTLVRGDVITLDSAGKFAKTVAGDEVFYVAETAAAAGDMVAGRHETGLFINVQGHDGTANAAIAVGDDLMVAGGVLRKHSGTSGVAKVGKAMDAVTSGATALVRVLLLK